LKQERDGYISKENKEKMFQLKEKILWS